MYDTGLKTNEWSPLHYEVRVRPTTPPPGGQAVPPQCLWGSAGLYRNIPSSPPLILHIRNDLFGEPVTFGTQVVNTPVPSWPKPPNLPIQSTWGILQPGECVSIPLQEYSGVFATCDVESTVYCSIRA
ncbi:MAG: hypothetical protein JO170_29995 [Verrucomicrobia bacterium]|nr:hypothetical protein [Verrucomicrobiota bacterium]